jgi:hypothetical protein
VAAFGGTRGQNTGGAYRGGGGRSHGGHTAGGRHHQGASGKQSKPSKKSSDALTYLPSLGAFFSTTMDVYSGGSFPPAGGTRESGVNILLTGNFLEGSRQRVATGDAYTHVAICDTAIEIRDSGGPSFSGGGSGTADYITIPAGKTDCYWQVVFHHITVLPGIGKKKVIMLVRQGNPSKWTDIV